VIYLGAGTKHVRGKGTGLEYHVSDHHRRLKVHRDDVAALLRNRAFILEP
jgi:hypothetical protein